ncbi:MAG: septum formation family protein [Acidimicrobiales bacterium]
MWDATRDAYGQLRSVTVPCSAPHYIEIVGGEAMSAAASDPYPGRDGMHQLIHTLCDVPARDYLGYAVDLGGRFTIGAIAPSQATWANGDRTMWCGIEARAPNGVVLSDDGNQAFTGVVKGQDQTYLLATGTCLAFDTNNEIRDGVPCSVAHAAEIVGTIDVHQLTELPTTEQQWSTVAYWPCHALATGYFGKDLPQDIRSGWFDIDASSWAAGRRSVQCFIGRYDAQGQLVTSPGPIRP